jgi:hypothetical protein
MPRFYINTTVPASNHGTFGMVFRYIEWYRKCNHMIVGKKEAAMGAVYVVVAFMSLIFGVMSFAGSNNDK